MASLPESLCYPDFVVCSKTTPKNKTNCLFLKIWVKPQVVYTPHLDYSCVGGEGGTCIHDNTIYHCILQLKDDAQTDNDRMSSHHGWVNLIAIQYTTIRWTSLPRSNTRKYRTTPRALCSPWISRPTAWHQEADTQKQHNAVPTRQDTYGDPSMTTYSKYPIASFTQWQWPSCLCSRKTQPSSQLLLLKTSSL